MNKLMRKTAAVLMAAAVSATGLSANSFAANADQCPHCGGSLTMGTDTVSVEYGASVAKPTYKVKGSAGTRKIRLSTSTSGATIYYTTDGSNPTTNSTRYTGLITVKKNTRIKAVAVKGSNYSNVMTKTIRVATVLGDVTGDGSVNETDYKRLISWIDGETTYGCRDNADVSGNGKVNRTDAEYLRQYLDGEIDVFPAAGGSSSNSGSSSGSNSSSSSTSSSIKRPTITVYRSYGGKKIQLETDTSDATIYYTTDGSDPTRNSTKYTKAFMLEKDATIKAVAYKGGKYSTIKSREVEVERCATPTSDMDESKQYTDSVKVALSCVTAESRIYYTTDGSDPVRYGRSYTGPITLTADTTLKVFAEAKGCTNSEVRTFNYKVQSTNFTIRGVVWDDTTNEMSKADGIKQYGERGINGITVKLINTSTNYVEQTVTTSTINGVEGSYILDKAKAKNTYKVTFEFNGQKYRAYGSVVSGGNQAITSANISDLVIKNGGAYTTDNKLIAPVNNLSSATVSSAFSLSATTNASYSAAADNVNLALASNVYGNLNLSFGSTSVTSASTGAITYAYANQKVYGNDTVTYTFTVANDSPYQNLRSGTLYFHLDKNLDFQNIHLGSGSTPTYNYVSTGNNGLQKYSISCPAIEAGGSVTFTVTAKVKSSITSNTPITCYAEVAEYSFVGACFDKDSTPGNFGSVARETDEAVSVTLAGYSDLTASQSIVIAQNNPTGPLTVGNTVAYRFTIVNGTGSINDFSVSSTGDGSVETQCYASYENGNTAGTVLVKGVNPGMVYLTISLRKDSSNPKTINISVQPVPVTQQ